MTTRALFIPLAVLAALLVTLFATIGVMARGADPHGSSTQAAGTIGPGGFAIVLTKTVGTDPATCATTTAIALPSGGGSVTYCYRVTNTGIFSRTIHDLVDSELGTILQNHPYVLVPGATTFVTASAVVTVDTTNVATWTARSNNTDPSMATASATVTILPPVPDIVLTKTVGLDPNVCATTDTLALGPDGAQVAYCYTVENTGQVTLTLHDLDDDRLGSILSGFNFALAPGASVWLTRTATITQTTLNEAIWTGYNPGPTDVVTSSDRATVTVVPRLPDIVLTKTVGTDPNVCATTDTLALGVGGGPVTYCYTVENTGNITLNLHDLDDDQLGPILSGFPFALAPGATVFVTESATITVDTVNEAIWTGYNPGPRDVVTATDRATVTVTPPTPSPDILLVKTVGTDPNVCATSDTLALGPGGGPVTYCYTVENTGQVTLTLHDLDDDQLGTILTGLSFVLGPGATTFVTTSTTISVDTVNEAVWTGYNPGPTDVVTSTDRATVTVAVKPVPPDILLVKTVGTDRAVCATTDEIVVVEGTEVTYCYTVENTGLVTLTRHDLDDDQLGNLFTGLAATLPPGATAFVTATATIDVDTVNEAVWTGYNPGPTDVVTSTDRATVTVEPPTAIGLSSLESGDPGRAGALLALLALLAALPVALLTHTRRRTT